MTIGGGITVAGIWIGCGMVAFSVPDQAAECLWVAFGVTIFLLFAGVISE